MKNFQRVLVVVGILALLGGCTQGSNMPEETSDIEVVPGDEGVAVDVAAVKGETLPVYMVTQTGLEQEQAAALAKLFGIDANILAENGAGAYSSEDFLAVPTKFLGEDKSEEDKQPVTLEEIDLEALQKIQVLGDEEAIKLAESALAESGLAFENWGPIEAQPSAEHSVFQAVGPEGESLVNPEGVMLDTHVNYELFLGGVPLVGPGAKVKVVLNGEAQALHLTYAMRGLKLGREVPVIPQAEAGKLCEEAFRAQGAGEVNLKVQPELVYYAPPLDIGTVKTIYPHYACNGMATAEDNELNLRTVMLPAVQNAPEVSLSAKAGGASVQAEATVKGGTEPYSYSWGSSTTPVMLPNEPKVSYEVQVPGDEFQKDSIAEEVSVVVVDANGLQAAASQPVEVKVFGTLDLLGRSPGRAAMLVGGVNDVGAEWIGSCGGLGGSASNAAGFVNNFSSAGYTVRFNWGNYNAWERDFVDRDERPSGIDHYYVDNVDFTFYTGHASANDFYFCSTQDDHYLSYTDNPRWGDSVDIEWLTIAACGPLQLENSAHVRWWQRWGPAFQGLHLFMGYQNVSWDNTVEGAKLSQKVLSGKTVRQAWVETAIEVQPSSVWWAVMGPIGNNGSNYNDHVWGKGSVGPDIRGSNKVGYWLLYGSS